MLQEALSKILDLPYPIAFNEKKKLENTYLFLNGEKVFVYNIEENYIKYTIDGETTKKIVSDDVETLVPFLPETGIYILSPEEAIYLTKLPIKQWKKSYSSDFYSIKSVGLKPAYYNMCVLISKISEETKAFKGYWLKGVEIMFFNTLIGFKFEDGTFKVENSLFAQEIMDLIRDGDL